MPQDKATPLCIKYPDAFKHWNHEKNGGVMNNAINQDYVWWICHNSKCKHPHEWQARVGNKISVWKRNESTGCPYCSRNGAKRCVLCDTLSIKFPEIAAQWHPMLNDMSPDDVSPTSIAKVWWLCPNSKCEHKHEWESTIYHRTQDNSGCPWCSAGNFRKICECNSIVKLRPDLFAEWHPVLNAGVNPKEISLQSHVEAWWKCPAGHEYQDIVQHRTLNGSGCEECLKKFYDNNDEKEEAEQVYELSAKLPDNIKIEWFMTKDSYINCTKICKAFGKRIDKWKELESSKAILRAYSAMEGLGVSEIKRIIKGGNNKNAQGTFYPSDIAIYIVQWCDPYFALYVSRVIRQLLLIGKVSLGNEKTREELDKIWIEKIEELRNKCLETENERDKIKNDLLNTKQELVLSEEKIVEIKAVLSETQEELTNTQDKLSTTKIRLEKTKIAQHYPTISSGLCFYICHDIRLPAKNYKIGKTDDINSALRAYRRNAPKTVLDHVVYLSKRSYSRVEDMMKQKFFKFRDPNHEVVSGIDLPELLSTLKHLLEFMNYNYVEINPSEKDEYNRFIMTE